MAAAVNRVVVGVSGSVANLAALHAAARVARRCDALLVLVHVWSAPARRALAARTVEVALEDAFGGSVPGVEVITVLVEGDPRSNLARIAVLPGDLLVLGCGRRSRLMPWRTGATNRATLRNARCPVMTVPPPPMIRELRAAAAAS